MSSASTYLVCAGVCLSVGGYAGYKLTSDHYTAKIEKMAVVAEEEKNAIQAKGDKLVGQYVEQINLLRTNVADLQRQVPMVTDRGQCSFSLGFVRVFNSSADGQTSNPSSTDGQTSTLDQATLLGILIENNEKYNQLSKQLIDLQEFLK
jgi:hypothetical protein